MDISCFKTYADLKRDVEIFVSRHRYFAPVVARCGFPRMRRVPRHYGGLASIIIDQQISRSAAASIRTRLERTLSPFTPHSVLSADDETLRNTGLSRAKIRTLRALAERIEGGDLCLDALASMEDGDVRASLISVHGIGIWTANIYLLCCLCRRDVWPANDLALMRSAADLFALDDTPSNGVMEGIARDWSPLRSVGARLLWDHYKFMKERKSV